MKALLWLVIVFVFAGCTKHEVSDDVLLPVAIGQWQRGSIARLEQRALAADYTGQGRIHVKVRELSSSAAGLDMVQRWKPRADTVVFYKDRYFIVVSWRDTPRDALQRFIAELEKRFERIK